jgi:hypothetical protein
MFSFFNRQQLLAGSLLAAALLATRPAAAQDVTISGLPASYYRGLRAVDGQFYYMLLPQEKSFDSFQLDVYGRDLQKKSSTDLKLERGWELGDARVVGDNTVFYFYTGKEALLLTLNAAGQKVKEVRFPAAGVYGSTTAIVPAGNGDFYLTYPIDAGKSGYAVARYGPDLTARWQKEYAPEKGKYRVQFFQANAAHVYAVADYSKAGMEVVVLDGTTGAEQAHKDVQIVGSALTLSLASLDPAGHLLLAGAYREQQKTAFITTSSTKPGAPTPPPPGGLFLMGVAPDGNQELLGRMTYAEDLAGKLNTHSSMQSFTVGDWPAVKMHSLLPRPGGGYTLLGETHKTFTFTDFQYDAAGGVRSPGPNGAAGPGPMRTEILDFVVLDISAQGKLEKIRRIAKPFKTYVDGSNGGNGTAEFKSKLAYTYRFLNPRDPAQLPDVVFLNWHDNLLYVNSLKPATDVRDNIFTRLYLDNVAVPTGPDRGERTERGVPSQINSPAPGELVYDEIFPSAPGKFVYSHYEPSKASLRLRVLDIPTK